MRNMLWVSIYCCSFQKFSPFFYFVFNIFSEYFLHPSKISLKFYMFFYIANRQAWGHHIDLHDSHLLALEHQLLQSEYEDYAVANTSSIACLRSVALIVSKLYLNNILMCINAFMCLQTNFGHHYVQLLIILLLRQALMVTRDSGMVQESSTFFSVSLWCPL